MEPVSDFLQVVDADMIILEYKLLSRLIDLINLYLSLIFLSSMGDF